MNRLYLKPLSCRDKLRACCSTSEAQRPTEKANKVPERHKNLKPDPARSAALPSHPPHPVSSAVRLSAPPSAHTLLRPIKQAPSAALCPSLGGQTLLQPAKQNRRCATRGVKFSTQHVDQSMSPPLGGNYIYDQHCGEFWYMSLL